MFSAVRRAIWPMPLSAVLALAFGLLITITVGVVLAISVNANFRNTFSLLNDKSVLLVDLLRNGIRGRLDPAQRMVGGLAASYREGRIDLIEGAGAANLVDTALISNNGVEAIVVYKAGGGKRLTYFDKDGKLVHETAERETNPRVIAYMASFNAATSVRWGPLVHSGGDVYANVGAPLVRDGEVRGFIVAAVGTRLLSRIAREIAEANGTTSFILYGSDHVIAHSRSEQVHLRDVLGPGQPVAPIGKLDDPILRAKDTWRPMERVFPNAARSGISINVMDAADHRYIVITGTMTGFGDKPWTVGAYFPVHEVGDEVRRLMLSGLAGLAALILAVLVAVWLGRKISRPFAEISQQATRLATLDIDGACELPRSRIREIDREARSFNAMLTALRAFTSYVPRTLVSKLIQRGLDEAGRNREAVLTVLFTDIAGFTSLSEKLPAHVTADLLNRHFEALVAEIDAESGTVDKFLGDGLMAFWGAPDDVEDQADAAVRAARNIAARVVAEAARAREEGEPPIRLRIAVHTGPVIVGNIGAFDRVNYTIIGDTVNVCQRLQLLGKEIAPDEDAVVLVSGDTRERMTDGVPLVSAGSHPVRGRDAEVEVWRIPDAAIDQRRAEIAAEKGGKAACRNEGAGVRAGAERAAGAAE